MRKCSCDSMLLSENETLQKEKNHLIENQAKLISDSRKREQDLRKQVRNKIIFFILLF